jgi:hypothetical protein
VFCCFIPQAFGLTLPAKASYFLQVVGMKAKISVMWVIIGLVCGLFANAGSFLTMAKFGRRKLIVPTLISAALLWTSMGIAGCFNTTGMVWWTALSMLFIICICGLSCWPASGVVASETSALHLRAKAQGIAWITNGFAAGLMGFVLPYMFNPDQGNLRAKTGFVYGALSAVAAVVAWLIVPEMKGGDFVDIDKMFFEKWSEDEGANRGS